MYVQYNVHEQYTSNKQLYPDIPHDTLDSLHIHQSGCEIIIELLAPYNCLVSTNLIDANLINDVWKIHTVEPKSASIGE